MATGLPAETGAGAVDVAGTTSVTGEDSADDNGTDEAVVEPVLVDEEVDETSSGGAYVVSGCSTSVPVSIGSGLDGNPLQSTRYG